MLIFDELRDELNVDSTSETDYVEALEASAVAYIEKRTNRYFGPVAQTTEYVIADGSTKLWLAEAPSTLPASVIERAFPGATSSTTITAAADDGYTQRGICLVRKGYIWSPGFEYEVTYERGYASGEEPADIRQAVAQLVGHWYENRLPVGDIGVSATALPHHVDATLRAWTRRPW